MLCIINFIITFISNIYKKKKKKQAPEAHNPCTPGVLIIIICRKIKPNYIPV